MRCAPLYAYKQISVYKSEIQSSTSVTDMLRQKEQSISTVMDKMTPNDD